MHLSCNFLCFQILNLLLDFSVILIKQKLLFLLCFDNMIALISSCVFAFASASAMQIGVYKDFSFLIELRKCKPSWFMCFYVYLYHYYVWNNVIICSVYWQPKSQPLSVQRRGHFDQRSFCSLNTSLKLIMCSSFGDQDNLSNPLHLGWTPSENQARFCNAIQFSILEVNHSYGYNCNCQISRLINQRSDQTRPIFSLSKFLHWKWTINYIKNKK